MSKKECTPIVGDTISSVCDTLGCELNVPAWTDAFGEALSSCIADSGMQSIKTLSLFSGAGGLDIGFSDVGFEIVSSVEIEDKFCETLRMNTGEGKRFCDSEVNCVDIRDFSGADLGKIDFIIGGPPCQTFSAAGRRANGVLGTTDSRGVLFREYVRLLEELQPKGFLFENVYGIIGAQGGEAWREILKAFSEVGYQLYYRILDAADYGVPQHRERLIIVGLREGTFRFPRPTHGPDSIDACPFYNASTAVYGAEVTEDADSNRLKGRYAHLLDDIPPGLNYSFYTENMGHPTPIFAWRSKFSDFLYKADPEVPVRTIKASGGAYTGPLHWENRFFTLAEYKRLQTFPDDYRISGNKQIAVKQIGNSVPPQLGRMMAIAIRQQVFGGGFPFELSLLGDDEELSFRKNKRKLTQSYKEKAAAAIAMLSQGERKLPTSRDYECNISPDFKFERLENKPGQYHVSALWADDLTVEVRPSGENPDLAMTIEVRSSGDDWKIGVDSVRLKIYSFEIGAFTLAWKAFEKELIDNKLKADLVQLNGYYQYEPRLTCSVSHVASYPHANVVKSVLEGNNVASIVGTACLAEAWDVKPEEVILAAEHLKSLGYEVRNNSTNPQIEKGNWLIPYAFPTLTHLSVQLWKKLR